MILNEIKCHVNTSLGLVGGMHPLHSPPVPRLVKRGDFSNIHYVVKSHYGFATVKMMKYISQHCYDKIMDGKMVLHANVVFRIVQNHGK